MNEIKNKIIKTGLIDWHKIKQFQPENLKSITQEQIEKLKTSIIKNGFASPFLLWEKGKTTYTIDGHHRIKALKEIEKEGKIKIPANLPCSYLDIKTNQEAKKLVLIYNSHYAEINQDGLFDFVADLKLEELEAEIELPELELDIEEFNKDVKKEVEEIGDINTKEKCPACGYEW